MSKSQLNRMHITKTISYVLLAIMVSMLSACGGGGGGGASSVGSGSSGSVKFSWEPNPGTVTGYVLYFGNSSGSVNTFVKNISVLDSSFNATAPSMSVAASELGINAGDTVCFKVKAYNESGFSGFTNAVCKIV